MKAHKKMVLASLVAMALAMVPLGRASAAVTATSTFSGTITSTMSVNNGTNTGSIPAGTPYTGTLTFDSTQAPAPVAYGGGSKTTYAFDNLAFTIGTSTANSGPGRIDVYDNLTSAQGYPTGDSVYVNFAGVAPSGLLAGAQFNWMGLALLDSTGTAVTNGALPANLDITNFPTHFSEFNFGTQGTPWGAGNTSMIQGLSTLSTTGGSTPPPTPTVCSGTNQVETAYVARNPGYIVVNGGLNLLDHLWTTNLNSTNTTFEGGLVNWYQTGLIVSYTGTTDSAGCILDHLTVAPAVSISTSSLPSGTTGVPYQAPVSAAWGVAPYQLSVSGLPAGLSFDGTNITGTPALAGSYTVTVSATDSVAATATAQLPLSIAQGGNYTIKDESKGKITAVDPVAGYVMVGSKKLVWNSSTVIIVNTPNGELHVVDSYVQVGMKVQWKGLRDKATNTVMTSLLEIN